MHHIHMSHTIHIKPCKTKLCIESHSTGLCVGYDIHGTTHTAVPIDRKHSLNDPHVQLITSTVHIADLIKNNGSHLLPPHI